MYFSFQQSLQYPIDVFIALDLIICSHLYHDLLDIDEPSISSRQNKFITAPCSMAGKGAEMEKSVAAAP